MWESEIFAQLIWPGERERKKTTNHFNLSLSRFRASERKGKSSYFNSTYRHKFVLNFLLKERESERESERDKEVRTRVSNPPPTYIDGAYIVAQLNVGQ